MVLSVVGDRRGGMFHKGDEFVRVTDIELATTYEENTRFHTGFEAKVTMETGDKHVDTGKVKGFIPLRNRRSEQITYICEGMTEYTLDGDRVGYGIRMSQRTLSLENIEHFFVDMMRMIRPGSFPRLEFDHRVTQFTGADLSRYLGTLCVKPIPLAKLCVLQFIQVNYRQ